MSPEPAVASPEARTTRAGWGWLLMATGARFYLVLFATLAACAVFPLVLGLSGAVVLSSSMEPHISIGDVVLSKALPPTAPAPVGRVITFQAPVGAAQTGDVLHRLVAVNSDGSLMTKGDANARPDTAPLARQKVSSQACLLVPWVGLPSVWLGSGAIVPLALWVLLTVASIGIGVLDTSARRPPRPRAPPGAAGDADGSGLGSPGGSVTTPAPSTPSTPTTPPSRAATPVMHRLSRLALSVRPSLAAAVVLLVALVLAPLGVAGAAFSATTGTAGVWATSGPATRLAFVTSPPDSMADVAFGTQPVVEVRDASGDIVGVSAAPVTLSIVTPFGATLTCDSNPAQASNGVATFVGCAIDRAGTYVLRATSGTLTSALSTQVTITGGPATRLSFATNPSGATGGVPFITQPAVRLQDAAGDPVTSSGVPVSLSLTSAAGATLTCTTNPQTTVSGTASFVGCAVDRVGTYTLTATSTGLVSTVSSSFTVTRGPAKKLVFTTSPSASTSGRNFSTQPRVTVQDAGGNTVTTPNYAVTLSITPPAGGGILTCTAITKTTSSGVAAFVGCRIYNAGTYTLTATSGSLTPGVSNSFTVAGTATRLAFTTNPSNATISTAFATQPVVTVLDADGYRVTTSTARITLSITTPGGATLNCSSNPKKASSGVAAFSGCRINKAGTYTLTARASGLTAATSTSFTITAAAASQAAFTTSSTITPGTASKVAFTTSPTSSTSNTAFATQPVVTVQDADGNTVTGSAAPVTLALTTAGGATLTCTANPAAAVAGIATFAGCTVDRVATYTLTATSSGVTSATSASFTITAGAATRLTFTTNPSNATASTPLATQPVVTVQDAGGNNVTTGSTPVTLAITTPAGAVLTCTSNPRAAVSGLATFSGCRIDMTGTYTLTATATGLTSAVSASITISTGVATRLVFAAAPSDAAVNSPFATEPVVTVQDASGNTVTSSTASITLGLTSGGGATLTCTANSKNPVAGVATFTGCRINRAGTYTLTASASSLTAAVSNAFTIS